MIPLSVYGQGTTIHQNRQTPYAMLGRRSSPREFLLETLAAKPNCLTIWTDCLVTKVVLEDGPDGDHKKRAVGVALCEAKTFIRAHVSPNKEDVDEQEIRVREGGEVILCGGAFNTPQLLMLSGIGDKNHLTERGIVCQVSLPGVGKNLQDRYEVSVVCEMKKTFRYLMGQRSMFPRTARNQIDI